MVLLLITGNGCDDDQISVYREPRQKKRASTDYTDQSEAIDYRSSMLIDWDLPAGWRYASYDHPIRQATILAGDDPVNMLEIAVTSLPGDGGGLLANINRWRWQIGLEPVSESNLNDHVQILPDTVFTIYLVDLTAEQIRLNDHGNEPGRLLAAVVSTGESTWFVKAVSSIDIIAAHRDAFIEFVRSFRYHGESR